jgi:tight adherence protein B
MRSVLPILLAAAGGGAVAFALRDALRSAPAALDQLEATLLALTRIGEEGRTPSEAERRRLGAIAGAALGVLALLAVGWWPAVAVAVAGPSLAGWAVAARERRYRRSVESSVAPVATGLADALGGGGSLRSALLESESLVGGPAGVELARVRADLLLGIPTRLALEAMAVRIGSPRVDELVAAATSQERAGGDLAHLLRRHAAAAAQRERAEREARSATAQARLTGGMVVAMPFAAALLVEMLSPGFVGGMLAEPAAVALLAIAGALQLGGYLLIRRLGRVGE